MILHTRCWSKPSEPEGNGPWESQTPKGQLVFPSAPLKSPSSALYDQVLIVTKKCG